MSSLRIAHAYDIGTFGVMKALLESEGVLVLDLAIGGHLAIAGVDQGYYVEVREADKAHARSILEDNDLGRYILESDT